MRITPLNSSVDPLVSIVILNLERGEDLRRNIESLRETVNVPYDVIIVDNGSKGKETLDYLDEIDGQRTKANDRIFVHHNERNLGCSGGRKLGTELALKSKSKYILTVDNDVTYTPGWLEKLISEVEKSKKIATVSPLILRPHKDGKLCVYWNGGRLIIIGNYFMKFVCVDEAKVYGKDRLSGQMECDWSVGTAMLIKKEIAKKIGYNVSYLSGAEDCDYSFQIAELGYKMLNVPDSIVIHHPISFENAEKQKIEKRYLRERRNPHRMFESVMTFAERTAFNVEVETVFHTWRNDKIFLTEKGYPDLLGENTSFGDVSIEEAKRAYEAITKEREKRGIAMKKSIDMEKVFDNIPSGMRIKLQQKVKKYVETYDIKKLLSEELIEKCDSGDNRMSEAPSQDEALLALISRMAELVDDLELETERQHLAIIAKDQHIDNLNKATVTKDQHIANLERLIRDRDARHYQNLMNLTKEIVKIKKYSVFYNLLLRFRKEILKFVGKIRK